MAMSEEEQMAAMLAEMGMESLDDLDGAETGLVNPIPEAPISDKKTTNLNVDKLEENSQTNILETTTETFTEDEISKNSAELNNESFPNKARRVAIGGGRELTIPSLVHLMGLPTGVQVGVLDTKLDLISARLGALQSKLDRLQSQFDVVFSESQFERMEFQLTEIRSIMKKFFPSALQQMSSYSDPNVTSQRKAQVLSNSNSNESGSKKETSVHVNVTENEMEEEPLSDQDYQTIEAMKMRQESSKSTK